MLQLAKRTTGFCRNSMRTFVAGYPNCFSVIANFLRNSCLAVLFLAVFLCKAEAIQVTTGCLLGQALLRCREGSFAQVGMRLLVRERISSLERFCFEALQTVPASNQIHSSINLGEIRPLSWSLEDHLLDEKERHYARW